MEESNFWKNVVQILLQDYEKITEKYKKRKQVLRQLRKQNKGNLFPVDFTSYGSVSKIQTQDVYKAITFVSDVDVQAFITHFYNK